MLGAKKNCLPNGLFLMLCTLTALAILPGCKRQNPDLVQGYAEGEFVYVSSAVAGTVQSLPVDRGVHVNAGDLLYTLDETPVKAARDEVQRRLAQGQATLEDVKKGVRPTEMDALKANLEQARAALELSQAELTRQVALAAEGGTTLEALDKARSERNQDQQRVTQLDAIVKTGQLGSRPDQVAAAEANVRALEAALAQAEWNLSQARQVAPEAGLVFDTLYHIGEWVAAGRPVVVLLPPQKMKVRAFVPEARVGSLHPGDAVSVAVDGVEGTFTGKISFISPRAEYTPPVIYSREARQKLVFMIEATFDPETAAKLHPGQPVDVLLQSAKSKL